MKDILRYLCALAVLVMSTSAFGSYSLTILHANDGENAFFENGSGYGGIANFVTTMETLRTGATGEVVTVSAGDQILPGTALGASISNGLPLWPAIGHYAAGFDAMVLGNHEFDLGTGVTADYISSFGSVPATSTPGGFSPPAGAKVPTFVNSNLDFSADANLSPLVGSSIFSSTIVNSGTKNIGIVGVTTPELATVSNPGPDVSLVAPGTNPNDTSDAIAAAQLAGIVNGVASDLINNQGADNVILVGQLQGIDFDQLVANSLTDIDAIIAAGGGELMVDAGGHNLIPGDTPNTTFVYGQQVNGIPIATSPGGYNYVGRLVLDFDASGDLIGVNTGNSGLQAVDGNVVVADPYTLEEVEDPIADALASLGTVVATSEVALDSRRTNGLSPLAGGQGERIAETNLGNLIADAIADRVADENAVQNLGITEPIIGIMNGGGIRQDAFGNDTVIPAGDITELIVNNTLPFGNTVGYIEGITAQRLVDILENAVSAVEGVDGRFAQVSGFEFTYDLTEPAGDRVVEIRLEDGTLIFDDATNFLSTDTFTLGVFNFLATGGDDYPLDDLTFNDLGIGDLEMLKDYLTDDLGGVITAADYPEGGEGRITAVPEPTSVALLGLGGLALLRRRRS